MNINNEDKLISLANDLYWEICQDWNKDSDIASAIESVIVSSDVKSAKSFAEEIKYEMINYDIWDEPKYRKLWNKIKNYKMINESKNAQITDKLYDIMYAAIDRLYGEEFLMPQLSNIYEIGLDSLSYNLILNDALFDDDFSEDERDKVKSIMQQCAGDYIVDEIHSINSGNYRNDYYDIFYTFFAKNYIGKKMVKSNILKKNTVFGKIFGEYLNDINDTNLLISEMTRAFNSIKDDIKKLGYNVLDESISYERDYYTDAYSAISKLVKSGYWNMNDLYDQVVNGDILFKEIMDEMNINMYSLTDDEDEIISNEIITAMNDYYNENNINESFDEEEYEVYMSVYADNFYSIDDIKELFDIDDNSIIFEDEHQIDFYTIDAINLQDELNERGIEWDEDKNY